MFKFSYVQSVAGKAKVVDKDTFKKIITDTRVKAICNQIASTADTDAISRLKRGLPAFCWHAWFDDGKRKNYTAHPSGLIMIDIDHVDDPRRLWDDIKDQCLAYGALIAHVTPSTHGLRIVLPVPEGLDIEAAQTAYVKSLRLKDVDACTKDLARLSFCVPEEYFLHIDYKRLFEDVAETTPSLNIAPKAEVETLLIDASQKADIAEKDNALTDKTFDETFDNIPYALLVESLQELLGRRENLPFKKKKYRLITINTPPSTFLSMRLSMCLTSMTAKKDTTIKVRRMGISFLQGTWRTILTAGTRAVKMASRPERAVASAKDGIMKGSSIIMKMPNPNPHTLWVRLAPEAIRNTSMKSRISIERLQI